MIIGKYNCHIAYSGIIFHAKSLPMDYCPDFRRRITTKRETILLARCFVGWLFRWLVVLLIVKLQAVSTNNETTLLRYCLPDSSPIYVYNPETSSRVTLASLGTVFQTTKQPDNKTTRQQNNQITILYKRYGNANAKSYTIEPYCIKLHKQRWYVLGHFHYTEAELNPAEILWRVLKCKWLRPVDYTTTDSLSYATDSALAAVGNILKVNYSL